MFKISKDKNNKLRACIDGHSYIVHTKGQKYYINKTDNIIFVTKYVLKFMKQPSQKGGAKLIELPPELRQKIESYLNAIDATQLAISGLLTEESKSTLEDLKDNISIATNKHYFCPNEAYVQQYKNNLDELLKRTLEAHAEIVKAKKELQEQLKNADEDFDAFVKKQHCTKP